MNKYERAMLNGADVRDLVGIAMEDFWVDFEYDTEARKLVCVSQEKLESHRIKAERKAEVLKTTTLEKYRDELLIRHQSIANAAEHELWEKSAIYERALKIKDELEKADINDPLIRFAAEKLRITLSSIIFHMEPDLRRLKEELELAKESISELTEWSQDTRERTERMLTGELADAECCAREESGIAKRLQANMRAAEVFDEIFGSTPAKENEEDIDRE